MLRVLLRVMREQLDSVLNLRGAASTSSPNVTDEELRLAGAPTTVEGYPEAANEYSMEFTVAEALRQTVGADTSMEEDAQTAGAAQISEDTIA